MPFVSPVLTASIKFTAASLAALLSCEEQPVKADNDSKTATAAAAIFLFLIMIKLRKTNIVASGVATNITFSVTPCLV